MDVHVQAADSSRGPDGIEKPARLRICLITSLSIADFVDAELTAEGAKRIMPGNVGILTLASVLRDRGYDPVVVNLDKMFLDFRDKMLNFRRPGESAAEQSRPCADLESDASLAAARFLPFVLRRMENLAYDVFGLSSICSSYPLTVRLAEVLKERYPTSHVILGGPQASVVDEATMRAFRCVDFVVRGEAEVTLPALLGVLSGIDEDFSLASIPGITYRRGSEVVRNPNSPVIKDLDSLPLPAFDLDADILDRGSVYLEIGRGCPFACTFCSTNDFFRRNFRLKSTPKMLAEMVGIRERYGIEGFSLIHDMYTVDRKKVINFCEALLEHGGRFTFGCSARTDCIDDALIALMAKAGCVGIFFGIETGSSRLQSVIKKNLDLNEARARIRCADQHGIKTAVALICGFPDETRDDFRDTIHFFVDSLRFDKAEPQLSLLAPLAGTPIHEEHKGKLVLDHIFSDMADQGWQQDPADLELVRCHPDIFPNYYAVPTRWLERRYVKEVRDFVTNLAQRFRWLPVALLADSGDFLVIFDTWKAWAERCQLPVQTLTSGVIPYYCDVGFREDFIRFVRDYYIPEMARARTAIEALVASEAASPPRMPDGLLNGIQRAERIADESYPFQTEGVVLDEAGINYSEFVEALRVGRQLEDVPVRSTPILLRRTNEREFQVWEVSPSSAILMRLADGTRTVAQVARDFAAIAPECRGVPPGKACLFGLLTLRERGFIEVASHPVVRPQNFTLNETKQADLPIYVTPPEAGNTQRPWPWPAPHAGEVERIG
jgi:radical SAM superfamily enzyme YgiQ (UPF0313 family)